MRIAICTDIYLPQLSGVADSIKILATELIKRGHEVRLYAPDFPGVAPDSRIMRVPSYEITGSAGGLVLVFPFGVMKDMRKFKPDIIHTHVFSTVGITALYAAWRMRVPIIGTDHTLPADYLYYLKLNFRPFRFLVRKYAAWYHNRCDFVTAPGKNMIDELLAYGMNRPTQVISNHIPTYIFRPLVPKKDFKIKYGIGSRAVLIFGRIAIEKNLDVALAIYSKVAEQTDAELIFIGDGPYREEVERLIKERKLENRVRFLGVLRGETLVEAINACEVFLITSLSETQSMTTLQAMACGLPVVVINAGGIPEYVSDGQAGYVIDSGREDLFVEKLIELLLNPELAQRMGEAGKESIKQFSPELIVDQFEKLYAGLLQKNKNFS